MIALAGIAGAVLFTGYTQILRSNVEITADNGARNQIRLASEVLASGTSLNVGTPPYINPPAVGTITDTTRLPMDSSGAALTSLASVQASTGKTPSVGVLPSQGGVKLFDPWGKYYVYCRWQNDQSPGTDQGFSIISAGADRKLQTTCNDLAPAASSDDRMEFFSVANVLSRAATWKAQSDNTYKFGISSDPAAGRIAVGVNSESAADKLKQLNVGGDGQFGGNLNVIGQITAGSFGAVNSGAITATSLTVNGASMLNGSLGVTGASTLGSVSTGALTPTSILGSPAATLGATTTGTLGATGLATLNSANIGGGTMGTGTSLTVTGPTQLGVTTTTSLSTGSIAGNPTAALGATTINGNLSMPTGNVTVTSGNVTLSASGSTVTATNGNFTNISGTMTGGYTGNIDASQITTGILPVVRGGTGASTAAGARTNLDAQQHSVELDAVSGLSSTGFVMRTGTGSYMARSLYNTDIPAFTGATAGAGGTLGGVPAPAAGQQNYVLSGGGAWTDPNTLVNGSQINTGTTGVYTSAGLIQFKTNGAEQARITGAGDSTISVRINGGKAGTPATISGVLSADGTTAAALTVVGSLTGNADTATLAANATKLATPRTIGTSGDVTVTATAFDGSANITIPTSVTAIRGTAVVATAPTSGQALIYNGTAYAPGTVTTDGGTIGTTSGTQVVLPDGTVGTPALRFLNNTNMGLYRPASDTMSFVTAGTDRLQINGAGNIGIGTVPSTFGRLSVYSAATTTPPLGLFGIGSSIQVTFTSGTNKENVALKGITDANAASGITVTGAIAGTIAKAISTGNDGTLNSVAGSRVSYGQAGGAGTIANAYGVLVSPIHQAGTTTNSYGVYVDTPATGGTITNEYGLYQASTTAANILMGKLAIGAASPGSSPLLVTDASTGSMSFTNISAGGGGSPYLEIKNGTGSGASAGAYMTINGKMESWVHVIAQNNTSGQRVMRFGTGQPANIFAVQSLTDDLSSITSTPLQIVNSAPTNSFYINGSGNVGIGTAAPGGLLDVAGRLVIVSNGGPHVLVRPGANGSSQRIIEYRNPDNGVILYMGGKSGDTIGGPYSYPPAFFAAGAAVGGDGGTTVMNVGTMASGSGIITNTGGNLIVEGGGTGGVILFRTNGQTEQARITSTGAVGIGTTGPATKLDVAGAIKMGTEGGALGASCTGLGGAIRYNSGTTQFESCNGTVWGTLAANAGVGGAGSAANPFLLTPDGSNFITYGANGSGTLANRTFLQVTANATTGVVSQAQFSIGGAAKATLTGTAFNLASGSAYQLGGANALSLYGTDNLSVGPTGAPATTTGVGLSTGGNLSAGVSALNANTTGTLNVAAGAYALYSNTTGSSNTAVGNASLYTNTSGNQNTATGLNSLSGNTTGNNNAAYGYNSLLSNTTGQQNVAYGPYSLRTNATGNYNTATGGYSLYVNTGSKNTAAGYSSLTSNTADNNTAVGYQALNANTSGTPNTAVGYQALTANTTGTDNIAMGSGALGGNTTAGGNIGIGTNAGLALTTNGGNSFIGHASGLNAVGQYNTGLGFLSLLGSSGNSNTALGAQALRNLGAGDNNIAVGQNAGLNLTSGSNNIIIGTNFNFASATGSSQLVIGSALYGDMTAAKFGIGYYNTAPAVTLDVAGAIKVANDASTCASGLYGSIRWTGSAFEGCRSSGWTAFATGSGASNPFLLTPDGSNLITYGANGSGTLANRSFLQMTANATTGVVSQSQFLVGGAAGVTVTGTGVGIGSGTTAPAEKLAIGYGVNNDLAIGSSTSNKVYLGTYADNAVFAMNRRVSDGAFANTGLPAASFGFYTSSGDSNIRFGTAAANNVADTERMRIDKNGKVGIGTTAPGYLLDVNGVTHSNSLSIGTELGGYVASGSHRVQIVATGTQSPVMLTGGSGVVEIWTDSTPSSAKGFGSAVPGGAASADFIFSSYTSGWAETMRIASGGNMGIGTGASPTTKLDVAGPIRTRTDSGSACATVGAGTIRWNGTQFQGCDGSAWAGLATLGGGGGGGASNPFLLTPDGSNLITYGANGSSTLANRTFLQVTANATTGVVSQAQFLVGGTVKATLTGTAFNIASGSAYQINGANAVALYGGGNNMSFGPTGALASSTGNGLSVGQNLSVGYQAMNANTTGTYNTMIGYGAGFSNTSGASNTAVGNSSLRSVTTGQGNTAVGSASMSNMQDGIYNVAVGPNTLSSNVSGYSNTAVGNATLAYNTGSNNSAIGDSAGLNFGGSSFENSALLGVQTGIALTTGSNNTLLGYNAGSTLTTGGSNIIIGSGAQASSATVSNQLNIGGVIWGDRSTGKIKLATTYAAPATQLDVAGAIKIANDASTCASGLYGAIRWSGTAFEGCTSAGWGSLATGGGGASNPFYLTPDGTNFIYYGANGTGTAANRTFLKVTANATTGVVSQSQFLIGGTAAATLTGSTFNLASGSYQIAGSNALSSDGGSASVMVGPGTVLNPGYVSNTAVGANAMNNLSSASLGVDPNNNTAIGAGVMPNVQNGGNTAVGAGAGSGMTGGNSNTLLGYNTGTNINSGVGNIVIGAGQSATAAGVNNQLNIGGAIWGDLSTGKIKLATTYAAPATQLDVAGAIKIANDASTCASGLYGAIRWSGTAFEGCTSAGWGSLATGGAGASNPFLLTPDGSNFITYGANGSDTLANRSFLKVTAGASTGTVSKITAIVGTYTGVSVVNGGVGIGTASPTGPLTVQGGTVASGVTAGAITINGQGTTDTNGGDINIKAGDTPGGYVGGSVNITSGVGNVAGGYITLTGGQGNGASNAYPGGPIIITGGYGNNTGGGPVTIKAGDTNTYGGADVSISGSTGAANGGAVNLTGGTGGGGSTGNLGGGVVIKGGAVPNAGNTGGNVTIQGGTGTSSANGGNVILLGGGSAGGAPGNVGIGTTVPNWPLTITAEGATNSMTINSYGSGVTSNLRLFSADGTAAAPTAVAAGRNLGQIAASGFWTGKADTYFVSGNPRASIFFNADEAWSSASNNGTRIAFWTTPNGSGAGAQTERLRIGNDGNVSIGTAAAGVVKLDVNGAIKLANDASTCASGIYGAIRWSGTAFEGCTSAGWGSLATGGGAAANPFLLTPDGSNLITYGANGSGTLANRTFHQVTANATTGVVSSQSFLIGGAASATLTGTTFNIASGSAYQIGGANAITLFGSGNNLAFGPTGAIVSTTGGGLTTGANLIVGYQALNVNTTGNYNTAIGYRAAVANTIGYNNTAVGATALGGFDTAYNTAIGFQAMGSNNGSYSTAVGVGALGGTGTGIGSYNTAMGYAALNVNTSGTPNTAVGYNSLKLNSSGVSNTALGANSLQAVTTAGYNTAVGESALFANTAAQNTAVGYFALKTNTTGTNNSAMGYQALNGLTTGSGNTAIGWQAGASGNAGLNNSVQIGFLSYDYGVSSTFGGVMVGANAKGNGVVIGRSAGQQGNPGGVSIGTNAGNQNTSSNNVLIGTSAGYGAASSTFDNSVLIGTSAGTNLSTGSSNVAVGYQAALAATTGANNTLIGYTAGNTITTGGSNIVIGSGQNAPSATGSSQLNIGGTIWGNLSTGKIFIGTTYTAPAEALDVGTGNVRAAAFISTSDARLKDNIKTVDDGLGTIRKLRGVTFTWKKDGTPAIGLIAQEVEAVLPQLVREDTQGFKAVMYANLVAPLIEAVKSVADQLDALSVKVAALLDWQGRADARLDALEKKLDALTVQNANLAARNKTLETELKSHAR